MATLQDARDCHKHKARCFAMCVFSGKPRSLTSTDKHTGKKCEATKKSFDGLLVICQI